MMIAISFSAIDHTYELSYNSQAGIKNKSKKQGKKNRSSTRHKNLLGTKIKRK